MKKLFQYIVISIIPVILFLSCTRRDLEHRPMEGNVKITLDWKQYTKPGGTAFTFYNSKGQPLPVVLCSNNGYQGKLPVDTYKLIIHNTDMVGATPNFVGLYGEEYVERDEEITFNYNRDLRNHSLRNVYGLGVENITVEPNFTTEKTVAPINMVKAVTFLITTTNIHDIRYMDLNLTGIVPTVYLKDGKPSNGKLSDLNTRAEYEEEREAFVARETVLGFSGKCVIEGDLYYSEGGTVHIEPLDLTDKLVDQTEEEIEIEVNLELEDLNEEINMIIRIAPWTSGNNGGGIVD